MLLLLKVVRSGELMFHYGQLGSMMRLTTKRKIKNNRFGNYGDSRNLNLSTFPCRHARYKTARQPH